MITVHFDLLRCVAKLSKVMLELRATLLTFTDLMGSRAGTSQWFYVLDLLEDAKESWQKNKQPSLKSKVDCTYYYSLNSQGLSDLL